MTSTTTSSGYTIAGAKRSRTPHTEPVEEGDYYQGEFYFLLLCSLLGMVVMSPQVG